MEIDRETLQLIIDGVKTTLSAEMKGINTTLSAEFKGFKETIITDLNGFKDVVAERDRNICKELKKIDLDKIQHDKRISKVEKSIAYQVGKIVGISSFVGGIITFIGIMLK